MQLFNTGLEYLKIDIASNFGLDKKTWDQRIEWYDQNESKLDTLIKKADTPALFYAGMEAMKKAKAGEPSGYPISLDATSSGLQILACLTGDRKAAELCNVINTGKRQDAYTVIYHRMLDKIGGQVGVIKRDDTKQAILTSLYGSQAVPKQVFGTGALLSVFDNTMSESAPAAWDLNKAWLALWDPTVWEHSWTLPDNFHVHVKVMGEEVETIHVFETPIDISRYVNMPVEEGRSLGANTTHSIDGYVVREICRRCNYDVDQIKRIRQMIEEIKGGYEPSHIVDANFEMVKTLMQLWEKTGMLSARIFDHLDYTNIRHVNLEPIEELLASLPKKPFKVISIHDCFRCLPNYGNDLRMQYNRQLFEIARGNLLQHIMRAITGRAIVIEKLDPEMYRDILQADYALS